MLQSVTELTRKLGEALQVTLLSSVAKQPNLDLGRLVFEVPISHTHRHTHTQAR